MIKAGTRTIDTHRLILRRFRAEDALDMYENWASDPEVTRFLTWPAHSGVDVTRALLDDWIGRYQDGCYFSWAIEWKETGRVIGNIAAVRLNEETEEAEIGYCLSRTYWGRGIMPEALRAVLNYFFDVVCLNRVTARHDVNNPKSGRVMEKAGMKREGILRASGKNNQGICDVALYAMLRGDRIPSERRERACVSVRLVRNGELDRVNELRRQVSELHAAGLPNLFRPGFPDELRDYIHEIYDDPDKDIAVAEMDGELCGYAILNRIFRPENPFRFACSFLDIDEFGVDERCRRRGVATAMIGFIRDYARENGFRRIELNMWSFNHGALAFYEAAGFSTYRRYMDMQV